MAVESASASRLTLESSAVGAMTVAVLGSPGNDNAVLCTLNAGENITRLLFDCGAGCLDTVRFRELQQIDAVLFSHFHMDHVAGFDGFVRANFAREKPVRLFGPAGSHAILQHRLQGFLWDLVDGTPGRFLVTEIRRELKAVCARAPDPALHSTAPPTKPRRMSRLCSMSSSG